MSGRPNTVYTLPPLDPRVRNLLLGLFVLYIVELVLWQLGVPLMQLVLQDIGAGFRPWQILTRFLIQTPQGAAGVMISLVVLYLVIPGLSGILSRRQWIDALSITAIIATVLPMPFEVLGIFTGMRTGWTFLMAPLFVVLGLARPKGIINLFFVLPIPGAYLVWGTLIVSLVFMLAFPGSHTLEPVAAWIGIVAWWNFRGPGKRRRALEREADRLEKELSRFTVIDGGKTQGGAGNRDEWIH